VRHRVARSDRGEVQMFQTLSANPDGPFFLLFRCAAENKSRNIPVDQSAELFSVRSRVEAWRGYAVQRPLLVG